MQPLDHPIVESIAVLEGLPGWAIHLVLALGSTLENLIPPIPADTFVAVGGVLAGRGAVPLWSIALVVWGANVAGAWLVYLAGRRWGHDFFATGPGRFVLTRSQLARVEQFHARRGVLALFLVRLLPGLRAVAPAFAGLGGLSPIRAAVPIGLASAIWYGGLIAGGYAAGQNLELLVRRLESLNMALWIVAGVLVVGTVIWWWRGRVSSAAG